MSFGPLKCEGVGLSDGETKEKLWSYLRHFGKMTKKWDQPIGEMLILAHALACMLWDEKSLVQTFDITVVALNF